MVFSNAVKSVKRRYCVNSKSAFDDKCRFLCRFKILIGVVIYRRSVGRINAALLLISSQFSNILISTVSRLVRSNGDK